MIVSREKLTSIVKKVADITSGDKNIPGLMLNLNGERLSICYSDGHKSFIQDIFVEKGDTDKDGKVVVDFSLFKRIIDTFQPSGIISVSDINIEYKDKVLTLSVDQSFKQFDSDGNLISESKMAEKKSDIPWKNIDADMRTSVINRFDYDSIFNTDIKADIYAKEELKDILNRTSAEKNKTIYFSAKTQNVFVQNQAHLTSIPVSKYRVLSENDISDLSNNTSEELDNKINEIENRISYSMAINSNNAKPINSVFNDNYYEDINIYTKDKFVFMYIDSEERLGYCFEMSTASRAHTSAFERFNSIKYNSYQLTFLKDFLVDCINSALNSTKSDKTILSFEKDEDENIILVIKSGSSSASTSDIFKVKPDDIISKLNDLENKSFNISLQITNEMLKQLKTPLVAFDFDCDNNGTTNIRLSEINYDKVTEEYNKARIETKKLCDEQGLVFDENSTPTPVELKLEYREKTLNTKQFTILAK